MTPVAMRHLVANLVAFSAEHGDDLHPSVQRCLEVTIGAVRSVAIDEELHTIIEGAS